MIEDQRGRKAQGMRRGREKRTAYIWAEASAHWDGRKMTS
jgi:hypothetical protein